ncbi:unnamed protein product [Pseudo-nitzschia multistriata]|uniref:Uncharacterized protein n=1 Tax=Pseudo-nitzschia multistriata TaxID=183589 RepID=A0A448Z1Z9_9STRA|nr:unnamed protein product [Pseudo-nitzschia multistriata]
MGDPNHRSAGATASASMELHQQHQQAPMGSSGPPHMGLGGHPRYSQHAEQELRPGGPPPPMGYGGPSALSHGSFGNSYSSYPPAPYGGDGGYGGAPPPGSHPPGYPRGAAAAAAAAAYSMPPHSFPYGAAGYGPGGYPQSAPHPAYPYGGGYEGHYGSQGANLHRPPGSFRGPSPVNPSAAPGRGNGRMQNGLLPGAVAPLSDLNSLVSGGSSALTKKGGSSTAGTKGLPGSALSDANGKRSGPQQSLKPDQGEVERLRAAAATEITTEEVKPIQTDFHFFVRENIEQYRSLAEEEVKRSMEDQSATPDPMLVNSNLNTRLMSAWECLTKETRDTFMTHEETDRRRFMEDDEIASRHCATLTARGKSPRAVGGDSLKELAALQRQKHQEQEKKKQESGTDGGTPNTVAAKTKTDGEEKKAEESAKEESKRPGDSGGDVHESPAKKNKVSQ